MAKTFAKVLSATLAVTMLASVVPMTTASAATDKTITLLNKDGSTDTTARVGDSFELTANDSSLTEAQQKNGQYIWSMTKDGFLEMGQAADKNYLNKKKFTAKKIGMVEVNAKCKNSEDEGSNFVEINMGLHPESGRNNWNTGDKFRLYTLGDYDGIYTWQSNDTDVLTVSAPTKMVLTADNIGLVEGKGQIGDHISYVDVTAKKAGSASVTVTAKKSESDYQIASAIFNVNDAATSVTITNKNGSTVKEIDLDYQRLSTTDKMYTDEIKATSNNGDWILWSTSDENICSISGFSDGRVYITPHKVGSVTLKASTYKGVFAECVVNVKQAATEVKIHRASDNLILSESGSSKGLQMVQNDQTKIVAKMTPSTSTDYINTWTSSNTSVATVAADSKGSNNATVTAKGAGTATITAITNRGVSRTFTVNVSGGKPATAISLDQTSVTLDTRTSTSVVLTPKMTPSDTTDSITWTSSDESIAKFSAKTNLSATIVAGTKPGTATITATTTSGRKATCVVTVVIPATSIKLSETSRALFVGETATLTSTLTPAISNDKITYTTNNSSVLSLTPSADGKSVTVKALAAGSATVTAKSEKGRASATCTFTVTKKQEAASITFDYSEISVEKGKSSKIEYKINPTAAQDYTNVTWISSNTSVATVDSTGVVRGVAKGTATVTATTDNGKTARCTVTVTVPSTAVSLDATNKTIKARQGFTLKATMTPADTTDTVAWQTSNANVATVDTSGNVYGVAAGTATITATTTSGKKATCTVKVEASVADFIVNYQGGSIDSRMNIGGSSRIAEVIMKSGQTPSGTYTWKVISGNSVTVTPSSDTHTATIKPTSNIGLSEVQVTDSNGDTASIFYSVKKAASSIKFAQPTFDIDLNQYAVLPVIIDNGTGDDWIVWGSSDTTVVPIDAATGLLQGKKVPGGGNSGVATITATLSNGTSASCTVFVRQPATGVQIKKEMTTFVPLNDTQTVTVASLTLVRGRTRDIEIGFSPANSTDFVASWKVQDSSVCAVKSTSSKNDKITISALKAGVTSIIAETNRGQKFTIVIAVQENYPAVSLELGTEYVNLDLTDSMNNTYDLSATMRLSSENQGKQTTDDITWTSDNASIASVSEPTNSGCIITAKGAGVAHITATTTSGIVKTCTVKVVVPVTAMTFTVGSVKGATSKIVASGKSFQLTANITPTNSKDELTWTVADESIATISNAKDKVCTVTGVNGGTTQITCTAESGYSLDFTVQVQKSASEVTIIAPKTTLYVGGNTKLTAKLSPSDAQDSVEWSSSNANIVKVDEVGNVTAVAVGQATITAQCKIGTDSTVKATVTIKVVKPAESVTFTRTATEIQKGSQTTFTVALSAGSKDSVTWTSSNTKVATVDNNANNPLSATVKGVAAGTATITATTGSGKKVTTSVKVIENATSIKLNKTSVTVDKNSKVTLVATQTPSTASESVTWSTSNQNIATVSSSGVVTAKNVSGEVTITARTKTSGKTATCKIQVKPSKITGLKVKSSDAKSVTLTWTRSSEVNGYYVYRKVGGVPKRVATITNPATTTYKINNLGSATTYSFTVVGYKRIGSATLMSSYSWINATTRLAAVSGFKAASQSTSSIKLAWSKVSGATGYEVYRQSGSKWVKVATVKSNTYTNSKLKVGTAYTYRIRAYKTVGKTNVYSYAWTTLKTATKTATPALTVKGASKSVKISWKKVSGASGYEVFMSTSKNGTYKKIATLSSSKSSYTKTGLKKGSSCYIRVRTYKTVGGKKIYSGYQTKGVKVK